MALCICYHMLFFALFKISALHKSKEMQTRSLRLYCVAISSRQLARLFDLVNWCSKYTTENRARCLRREWLTQFSSVVDRDYLLGASTFA